MNSKVLPRIVAGLVASATAVSAQPLVPRDIIWQNNFEANSLGDSTGASPGVINGFRFNFPGGVVRDSETVAPFEAPNQYLELSPKNTTDRWGYRAIVTGVPKSAYVSSPVGITFDFSESEEPGNETRIGFGTGIFDSNPDVNANQGLFSLWFRNGDMGFGFNTSLVSVGDPDEDPQVLPGFTEGVPYRFTFITNFTEDIHEIVGPDGETFTLELNQGAFWMFDSTTEEFSPRVIIENDNAREFDEHISFIFRHFSVPTIEDTQLMQTIYVDNIAATNYGKPAIVWSGEGSDALWSNVDNWAGGVAPTDDDLIIFSGDQNLDPVNDLLSYTQFTDLLFENTSSTFILEGNQVVITERIANLSTASQFIEMPIDLDGTSIAIDNFGTGTTLGLEGDISGFGGILKKGPGTLMLSGTNDFSGNKIIDQGVVILGGDQSGSSGAWHLRGYGATGTTFGSAPTSLLIDDDATVLVDIGSFIRAGHTSAVGGTQPQSIESSGTVTNDGTLYLGRSGSLTLNGGSWTQNGATTVMTQGGGQASLTINEGTFTYTNPADFILRIMSSNNTRTRLNINGGTFVTGATIHNPQVDLAPLDNAFSDIILANGGTLRLSADIPELFTTAGANNRVLVNNGGGTIDTNGFDTTLDVDITGDGSLTKAGDGTLTTTGMNAYEGDTIVTGGTLVLASAGLADEAAVIVETGATLVLDFIGTDTINALNLGGTELPDGTYDATSHPAFLDGTGQLVVEATVAPTDTFASWATALGLSGIPTDDSDNDGISDALEFVLGTDPTEPTASTGLVATSQTADNMIVVFTRDDRSKTPDVTLTVETSTDLASWPQSFLVGTTTGESSAGVDVLPGGDGTDTITVTIPKNGASALFARIKVLIANDN